MGKTDLKEILGFELAEKELSTIVTNDPEQRYEVEKWLIENVGANHTSCVKRCNVEYIDYDEEIDTEDEFELKEYYSKVKKNARLCPNHRTCPIYCGQLIKQGEKCTLELIDTKYLLQGLYEELQVEQEDFNDSVLIGQLVSLNILYKRAMAGLAAAPLIDEIKTFTKGGMNIDTKINENFTVVKDTVAMMEKLRKSLLLNRDDKIKTKQVKKANDEVSAKKRVEEKLKNIDDATIIDLDVVRSVMGDDYTPPKTEQEIAREEAEKKKNKVSQDEMIEDI